MDVKRTERLAVAAMFASGLLWGLTWIPLKHFAREGISGLVLTVATYGAIGVLVAPWLWSRRATLRAQWRLVAANGMLGGMANACFVVTLMEGDVIRSMLLFYLAPVWGVVGGRVFLREVITPLRLVAVGLALAGALLVLGGPGALTGPLRLTDILAVAAGFFYAMQNVAARAADTVPVELKAAALFAGCALVGGVLVALLGGKWPAVRPVVGVQVALFAALWLVAAVATQLYGVSHLDAGRSSVLIIFELVASVVSAWLLTDEVLPAAGWIGGMLIVSAALLEARPQSEPDGAPA
ncbi:MAG: DMT family transporter [Burkholderiales bacterium]|nr:DMT family transporter [Burkholderiales bacterium]